eukprot:CAMPEP_0116997668 /NCGR_PEP_ID=MMETSP0472-20121206/1023_1 /TAXON_ID=693140 ORGANISM="Tiarina fusus, Strain LIS" /NCGR_SAMPLE_ID=MMETSP0472 /ASSEMBLY_ACC=CAM_ASM_000603 /LENGTH=345 /DNA_ID=CAMNT_0004696617 /DNA_START=301 /DNA_END=1338 /DNA_ORIENTATION=-
MTDWSTSTAPASNTAGAQEEKKRHKSRFMKFANVLMQFLERKDPTVYAEARTVIRDCEEQKRLGHVDSFSESVKAPLKDLVGPSYWKQARKYSKKFYHQPAEELEPLSMTEDPPMFSQDEVACLEKCLDVQQKRPSWMFPLTTKSCKTQAEELKLRRDRFWMLIRVLMKYLEKTEPAMFLQARKIIEDCMRRNKQRKDYQSLTQNIQTEIKQLVGINRWRRAEAYLAKILIKRADEEAAAEVGADSFSEYDLEITDDGLKSFGGHRSWEEDATPRGQPLTSLTPRTTIPNDPSPRRESRPANKRARSGDKDRLSLIGRGAALSLGGRRLAVAALDPKRRRVHSLN